MAVMNSRLASNAEADLATETTATQFHLISNRTVQPARVCFRILSGNVRWLCRFLHRNESAQVAFRIVDRREEKTLPVGEALMSMPGLAYGPLGDRCIHICVDMQRLFAEPSQWATRG